MKKILLLSFLFAATMLSAQKPVELPLWPNGAPNNNELTNSGQNHNNEWVSDVTTPTLTVYPASHPNGMAIIMCPICCGGLRKPYWYIIRRINCYICAYIL